MKVVILKGSEIYRMKKEKIFKEISNYKKILEDKGYKVIYIGLYGSQNYNVDDELSDIDVKAIILPNLHDIIFRKVTSKTIECENGSIDVKDLITFYDVVKKGNFNYIESIDTEYFIGDKYIKKLFKQFRPNLKSILGAMYEKRKALTHEYPSKKEEFEKWGFDPKQYHHIVRLLDLLKYNNENKTSKSYLKYDEIMAMQMINLKRNSINGKSFYSKLDAETLADECIEQAKKMISGDYKYDAINIDTEISKYIEEKIKLELINNNQTTYARQYRTFGAPIPNKDLEKFPVLKNYVGKDVSYIVYESIEIL